MVTIVALTLVYPIILNQLVDPGIDQGPLISGYLGLILLCAALVAIGVFVSSLFSNQIAAFVATIGLLIFLWWILGPVSRAAGSTGTFSEIMTYLDFNNHYFDNLVRGVIDLKDVVYYLSVTALALVFGTVSIEVRRWG
jgi:ABC-2 type transport system permease protein